MTPLDIKWVHVELSSNCNAWCPSCPRNVNGFGLSPDLIVQDLSLGRLEQILSDLPNLHGIQFCGNYGDPIVAKNIMEAIDLAMNYAEKIQIHTNGSIRSTEWWHSLGTKLKNINHDIWFGIDGIDDVHSIYRQGTSYEKIIENAKAFIDAGGTATWQFIPYSHNEHQIRDCLKISQAMGFKKFKLTKVHRNNKIVRHYKTGAEFNLNPPTEIIHMMRMPQTHTNVKPIDCMHISQPGIYISASGELSYCCYREKETKFDTLDELFYNAVDFSNMTCLKECGS